MGSSLLELGAVEILEKLEAGTCTREQLMSETLDRIEQVNPQINAIVSLRPREDLLAEAREADKRPNNGALHDIPIAIKDLVETAGIRTTHGSPIFAEHIPETDNLLARRIRDAGAIIIGKTNVPEFGLGSQTYNQVSGITRNPYDLTKTAGGSSGGAAAALAAGMVSIADGSDMMGSLRNPAAFCNVYGFRPSYGLVPDDPSGETFLHQLSTHGPMARTVKDLALLLDVISGPEPGHPHSLPKHASFLTACSKPPKPSRIGWLGNWNGYFPFESGILPLCETALSVFENQGHVVEPLTLEFDPESLWMSWTRLRSFTVSTGLAVHYENPDERKLLKPEAVYEIENGRRRSAQEIADASLIRSQWFAYLAGLFEKWDAIVLPSAQVFPFDADEHWPKSISDQQMTSYHKWMEVVVPASLVGLPALNVPVGFSESGLPMGMQIIGKRGSDETILRLGEAYHQATQWPQTKPPRNFSK